MSKKPARWKSYIFLLINIVVWGIAFFAVKPSFAVTTPFRYLLYRFCLAIILSLPILLYYLRKYHLTFKKITQIVGVELIGTTLALALVYLGLRFTTALEANLLGSISPLFVTWGGILLLKEKEERHEWLGLTLALLGTLTLVLVPAVRAMNGIATISIVGNILILLSHLANMFYFPLAKKYYADVPKLLVTSISFYVGAVSFLALSLFEVGGSLSHLWDIARFELTVPSVQIAVGYMAFFGSIIGLTAWIKGQDGIEVSEATLFTYLSPLIYIPMAYLLFREMVTPLQLAALALTLIGVALAEKRFSSSRRKTG